MKAPQSNDINGKSYARQLIGRAVTAEKEAEAARKLARMAKAKHKAARKAFKKAKELAKQARKDAKVAAKLFVTLARRNSPEEVKARHTVKGAVQGSRAAASLPPTTARKSTSKSRRQLVSPASVAPGVGAPVDNTAPGQE